MTYCIATIPVIAVTLLLSGCGDKNPIGGSGKDIQVAARINGHDVTVGQVNADVQKLGKVPEDKVSEISNQVLAKLVNQQLLAQKAIAEKLDSKPNVIQAIAAARNEILAQSYIQSKTQSLPEPTDAEIGDYYNKHPELFSARRIYRLQEVDIQDALDKVDLIRSRLTGSKNLEGFAQWLQTQSLKFTTAQIERSAEQLPTGLAAGFQTLNPGQVIITNNNGILAVTLVAAVASQPLTQDQAGPAIRHMLAAQKQREVFVTEVKALRAAAKIDYLGPFADAGKEGSKLPATPTATPHATADAAPNASQPRETGVPATTK
jgi:EpsD family peptidyl-prolyl cis-trans isomerase